MTPISPTALESAELAVHRCRTSLPNIVATAAITAYLAQAEKEGWVMVPKEPTVAMVRSGAKGSGEDSEGCAIGAWKAMLAVAQNGGEPCK